MSNLGQIIFHNGERYVRVAGVSGWLLDGADVASKDGRSQAADSLREAAHLLVDVEPVGPQVPLAEDEGRSAHARGASDRPWPEAAKALAWLLAPFLWVAGLAVYTFGDSPDITIRLLLGACLCYAVGSRSKRVRRDRL